MKITARARRILIVVAALLALFTIGGFLVLPPIVKSQLEKRLSAELDRTVTIGKVRVNPYALSLSLENFAVREKDGTELFLGWKRLYVNFDALSSLMGEWVLGEITLDGFKAHVAVNADSSLNFSDLLKKFAPAPAVEPAAKPSTTARPLRIGSLKLSEARVAFSDHSRKLPFATSVGPMTFTVTGFRTVSERGAPYQFAATTESGEKLAWSGTIQAEPFHSLGELRLENIVLAKYAPYYADRVQADLTDGKLSVRGRYEIDLAAGSRALKLTDGALELRDLKVLERATQAVGVELPALDIKGVNADALALKVAVESVVLSGGHLHVRRDNDGAINLLTMLRPTSEPSAAATAPAATVPVQTPTVTVGEVVLKNFQVDIADLAAPRPAQLGLSGIQFSIKNVTLAEGARMPVQLALNWAEHGTVQLAGTVSLKPLLADLKLDVAALEILPLSPYLEQFVNARITQGAVTTALSVQAALPEGAAPKATVTGDIKVEKFSLVERLNNEELAGFGALTLTGLRVATGEEISVALDEVGLAAPYARVIVNRDQTLNLAGVARAAPPPSPEAAPATIAAAPATPAPKITIGKVVISEGDYRFTDRSIEPNVQMAITQFGGTIAGLSSENMAKADVDLKASVDGAGPISITGKLDPLGASKFVDLKVDFKNVDLLPLSPYSGKYTGFELARGKLNLDVKLLVDGKKIDSANVVTLNQFTFGAATESPDATKLPVRLGVALLKDINGQMVIDLPVQGSTDDPNFRIGRVVLRVMVNLLTKAAVSPFKLLGSMFGGGGDELGFQAFAPGLAALQPVEIKKLETMAQALTGRPGLSVDLEGSYDQAADGYALKRIKFAGNVRRAVWEVKRAANPNIPPPDQVTITPEEDAVMVKKLFDEKFPPGTQFGTPLPAAPVVVAPPPPPVGIFKRVVNAVTFKGKREQSAAEKESARRAAEHEQALASAAAAGLPLEEMTGRLAETVEITDLDLRALAQERAQAVRDYFIKVGKISPDRLFMAKAKPGGPAEGKGPRVFLNLQ